MKITRDEGLKTSLLKDRDLETVDIDESMLSEEVDNSQIEEAMQKLNDGYELVRYVRGEKKSKLVFKKVLEQKKAA